MKKNILLIFALLINTVVVAQEVVVTNGMVEKSGDNIVIIFDATIGKVSTNEIFTIIPVLWNSEGEQSLTPIIIAGRNKRVSLARWQGVKSDNAFSKLDVVEGKAKSVTSYKVTVPFQKWMSNTALRIDKTIEGCCEKEMLSPQNIISKCLEPLYTSFSPVYDANVEEAYMREFKQKYEEYSFLRSSKAYFDSQNDLYSSEGEDNLVIHFKQGQATADMTTEENKEALRRIGEIVDIITIDKNVKLDGLTVIGVSSPEGNAEFNKQLSVRRAEVFIKYLKVVVPENMINIEGHGENWSGLRRLVEASDMQYKDEILDIIDGDDYDLDVKENRLKALRGGAPYKHLLNNLYPSLRQASYVQVIYTLKPNEHLERIKKIVQLINDKKYQDAIEGLEEFSSTPYFDNLRGVCYYNLRDEDMARELFQSSADEGNREAIKNIKSLNYQRDNVQYI